MAAGLALSIALMGLAATFIARLLDRYHWLAWLGLLVIVYVAAADGLGRHMGHPRRHHGAERRSRQSHPADPDAQAAASVREILAAVGGAAAAPVACRADRRPAAIAHQSEQEARGHALHAERHAKRRERGEPHVRARIEIAEAGHYPAKHRGRRDQESDREKPPPTRQKRSTVRSSFIRLKRSLAGSSSAATAATFATA